MEGTLMNGLFIMLTENVMMTHLLGLPPFYEEREKRRFPLIAPACFVMFFCAAGNILLFYLSRVLRFPEGKLFYPILLVGVIALLCTGVCFAAHWLPARVKTGVRKAAAEGAVSSGLLGFLYLSMDSAPDVMTALINGLNQGAAFLLAAILLQIAVPYICSKKMPQHFRGWRGLYLYAAILAMAAYCLTGQSVWND